MRLRLLAVACTLAALPAASRAQEPAPTLPSARALLAVGDREGARILLDRMLASETLEGEDRTEAFYLRARTEEDGTRYAEMLRELQARGLRQDRQATIHLALGQIAYVRSDFALALREFTKAREKGREEEGSLWEGLAAFALGDLEAARIALGRAEASGNRLLRQRARAGLGDVYRTREQWSDARDAYRELREEGPEGNAWWSTAVWWESECLDRLDRRGEADALRAELLEARPSAYEAPQARARLAASGELPSPASPAAAPPAATFSVQVGAFADAGNAEALRAALESRGVEAVRITRGDDALSRVLVGRGLDRARAESLGDSLGAELGVGFSLVPETRP